GDTIRPYNFIRTLSRDFGYEITLVSFHHSFNVMSREEELAEYCRVIPPIAIETCDSVTSRFFYYIRNNLQPRELIGGGFSALNFYYNPRMETTIRSLLEHDLFDAVYTQGGMAHYVSGTSLPKIVEPSDAVAYDLRESLRNGNGALEKAIQLILHMKARFRETYTYRRFDYCVMVSSVDRIAAESHSGLSNIVVIPNGTDTSYFTPMNLESDFPSLLYFGVMSGRKNVNSVLRFYRDIYPMIVEKCPTIRLYIVGANPPKDITDLSKDRSVVVTGFVSDIRPYIAASSVVIVPTSEGAGMKNKVLEAMAMRKPVVTTSIGAIGIKAKHGIHILIADSPKEFANRTLELIDNKELGRRIGTNARRLVEEEYSWEKACGLLDRCIRSMVNSV
ncbi:MAG: glycosyltransferase, partial [Candidatus Bathyarchaeota archaeon]|nr:glycosyltransferase [Candidatus Bathyarchaeota archaeon]